MLFHEDKCPCGEDLKLVGTGDNPKDYYVVEVETERAGMPFIFGDPSKLFPGMKEPDYKPATYTLKVEKPASGAEAFYLAMDHIEKVHPDRHAWRIMFSP